MATLNPTVALGRYGGGNSGQNGPQDYVGRLRRARLGLAVALTPIVMLFVSFTSAYIVRQGLPTLDESTGTYVRDWMSVSLPLALLVVNTMVLIFSSITMELARRQAARNAVLTPVRSMEGISLGQERSFPWLVITVVLGIGFLAGQWLAWRELAARGFYLASTPSSSFVYLLTAAHAVHLAGGLLVLLYAAASTRMHKHMEPRYIVVDTAAWYWHFLALLWLYIFALLEFTS